MKSLRVAVTAFLVTGPTTRHQPDDARVERDGFVRELSNFDQRESRSLYSSSAHGG
jgi:hypothetical protein